MSGLVNIFAENMYVPMLLSSPVIGYNLILEKKNIY